MKITTLHIVRAFWPSLVILSLAACSGGISNTDTSSSVESATVTATVAGLSGVGLVLQNNGSDNLAVAANGSIIFPTSLIPGDSYSVTVLTQPTSPDQTCVVTNGSGIVPSSGTVSVSLQCVDKTTATDTIGGVASGIVGSGLVLQDNGGDNLTVGANGSFTFPTALASGQPYNVTVLSPPINPYENCIVSAGSGITGGDNVGNVAVACSPNANPAYTIGGTVSGVSAAEPVVLVDNGRNQLTLTANGAFTFSLPIPSGSTYNVTALPTTGQQSQTCTLTNGSGTVGSADVTNVAVACKTNVPIAVSVSGLVGSGLVLQDNGTDNLSVNQSGAYTFAIALVTGSAYSVTILSQPLNPAQTCVVNNGTGTAGSATPVTVSCTTNTYAVGGTVAGLAGSGLTVQDNGGTRYPITANGAFTFPGVLTSGSAYSVVVSSQPTSPSQTCTVANGSGTVGAADVTVAVTCVTQTFTVGGTVTGLAGSGLTVRDNGGANYAITENGAFTIPGTVASGATYVVSVSGQPTNPTQTCTASNASGTVTTGNITNVVVTCVTQTFTVGGTLSGLAGTGLTVRDNGGNNYALTANGAFTIPGTVASGATYAVSVSGQPTNPTQICTPTNASGTVTTGNITSVVVTCVTQSFTVSGTVSGLEAGDTITVGNEGNEDRVTGNPPAAVPFNFPAQLSGTAYAVTVDNNDGYTCVVANGAGTVTNANVTNVAVTCGVIDAYLYVTDSADGTVSSYGLDQNFGALLPLPGGVVATGTQTPVSIVQGCGAVDGTAAEVLIANESSNSISTYAVNYGNGALTSLGTPVSTAPSAGPVFMDYSEGCIAIPLFGVSNAAASYSDDEGALTSVTNPVALGANTDPVASANLTFNPPQGGQITSEYVVDSVAGNVSQLTVNTANGVLSVPSSTVAAETNPDAIVVDALRLDGSNSEPLVYAAFVANGGSNTISEYSVDLVDGSLAPLTYNNVVQTVNTGTTPSALATAYFYLTSQPQVFVYYLYVANAVDGTISGYSVYPGTENSCNGQCYPSGYLSPILVGGANGPQSISTGGTDPVSLSVWQLGSDQAFLYVLNKNSNTVTVFSIDPTTGILTRVGNPVPTGASPTSATIVNLPDG